MTFLHGFVDRHRSAKVVGRDDEPFELAAERSPAPRCGEAAPMASATLVRWLAMRRQSAREVRFVSVPTILAF